MHRWEKTFSPDGSLASAALESLLLKVPRGGTWRWPPRVLTNEAQPGFPGPRAGPRAALQPQLRGSSRPCPAAQPRPISFLPQEVRSCFSWDRPDLPPVLTSKAGGGWEDCPSSHFLGPPSGRVPISGSLPQWTTPTAKASGGFFPSLSSLSPSLLPPFLLSLPPPPPFSLWITLPGTQRCLEVMNTVP